MSKTKEPKSPFKHFSVEEVFAAESCSYVILVGTDFYVNQGRMVFSKQAAARYYNHILNQVVDLMRNGTKKQKEHANRVIMSLKVLPLRIS